MAFVTTNVISLYNDYMENMSDQRVKDWFMMSSPLPTIAVIVVYVMFVTKVGPKLMENRRPFQLTNTLILYNLFQMLFSAYIFYHCCFSAGWLTDLKWFCQLPDYSMNPIAYTTVRVCWWVYVGKLFELLDTIFFVLRKKSRQITTLHIVHHGVMPVILWIGTKFLPGGSMSFIVFLNSFVHIVMYGYYFLAALGPRVQQYLWWKKYLTIFQMVQFLLILGHSIAHIFITDCTVPKFYSYLAMYGTILIFLMFLRFYRMEYNVRDKQLHNCEFHKTK